MMRRSFHLRATATAAMCLVSSLLSAQVQNTTTTFEYNSLGQLTQIKDALGHGTDFTYDEHGRRATSSPITAPAEVTSYKHDGLDQLRKVTDARGVVTDYTIDGLGNLKQTISADTGLTDNSYDEAGNLISRLDAKQQRTDYKYDVLGRIEKITYADNATVVYTYDTGDHAKGRLSKIVDSSGELQYAYDQHGRITSLTRTIAGVSYLTSYRYDAAGRFTGMTYPSGRSIDYVRDALNRVKTITTTFGGSTVPVLNDVSYHAFGPAHVITFGNGRTQTRAYDLDGRISSFSLANQSMAVTYDNANRITGIVDAASPASGSTYGYDFMDRLTSVATPGSNQTYTYDAVGNRKLKVNNAASTSYTYGATNNRLTHVGGQSIVMDANGSTTDKPGATFNYDARGRMVSANTAIGIVSYVINSLGQRVRKVTPTDTTVFHYDLGGKLIGETTTAGGVSKTLEYVYLGDLAIAVLK